MSCSNSVEAATLKRAILVVEILIDLMVTCVKCYRTKFWAKWQGHFRHEHC